MRRDTARLTIGRREIYAALIGIVLYAGLNWLTSVLGLSANSLLQLRPGIVVPILCGLLFGPWVGFAVGFGGNVLGDWLTYGSPWTFWHYHIGNGLIGMVPGLFALRWGRYRTPRGLVLALVFGLVGIVVGMFFSSMLDLYRCREGAAEPWCRQVGPTFEFIINTRFWPPVRTNIISMLILLPLILYNSERLDFRLGEWRTSGLLRRFSLVIVVSSALPTLLLGYFLVEQLTTPTGQSATGLGFRLVFVVVLTLLFTVTNAALIAQNISDPLLRLAKVARLVERNKLTENDLIELQGMQREDEIGRLSEIFSKMAVEVVNREQSLRRQVEELKIEIDEAKKSKAVEEITGTDYFADLQSKARALRSRSRSADDRDGDGAPLSTAPQPAG